MASNSGSEFCYVGFVIEKMLAHKQALAASANERERLNIDADVKVLGYMFLGHKIERMVRGR